MWNTCSAKKNSLEQRRELIGRSCLTSLRSNKIFQALKFPVVISEEQTCDGSRYGFYYRRHKRYILGFSSFHNDWILYFKSTVLPNARQE
jgi:hypothetical protein